MLIFSSASQNAFRPEPKLPTVNVVGSAVGGRAADGDVAAAGDDDDGLCLDVLAADVVGAGSLTRLAMLVAVVVAGRLRFR